MDMCKDGHFEIVYDDSYNGSKCPLCEFKKLMDEEFDKLTEVPKHQIGVPLIATWDKLEQALN